MRISPTVLVPIAAAALLAACSTAEDVPGTPTALPTATSTTAWSSPLPAPQQAGTPSVTTPSAEPAQNPLEGDGLCLDPGSAPVADALATLGDGEFAWGVEAATDAPIGQCPSLLWLVAVGGNSAAAPEQLLFFADGRYLGTGTSEAYAYTSVAGATDTSVTAQYRWLTDDEPFCCPTGGPADITYTWDGSQIVMQQPLPQEMLDSYGEGN